MEQTKSIAKSDVNKITWDEFYQKVAENNEMTADDVKLMHKTVAEGTNATEFKYFLNVAKASGLNPFLKEIWCYKDGKDNQIIFAGRDGFLKKAQENHSFAGIRSCEVCKNDEFNIDVANNKITHIIKDLSDRGEITGAYAIAFRKGGEPTIEIASMKTYNKGYNTWKSHPAEMIKKIAEVHALKKAFGISIIQAEEDFVIRNDKALPLGAEVSNEKVQDGAIAEAIAEVYKMMLKKLDEAKTPLQMQRLKKDIEKNASLRLLTEDAIEDLNIKFESKLSEINKDGK